MRRIFTSAIIGVGVLFLTGCEWMDNYPSNSNTISGRDVLKSGQDYYGGTDSTAPPAITNPAATATAPIQS